MKTVAIQSSKGKYSIRIGVGFLGKTGAFLKRVSLRGRVCVVTQKKVARFHLKPLIRSLAGNGYAAEVYYLPEGETAKSEQELFRLYRFLIQKGFERKDILLALGGGVVGDLAGFAAATYMRGIPFVNAATTLLAQVDSAIGGKTGINLAEGKNLIGAFYPPRLVVSDIRTLKTLPERELRASLAEAVKYGVIRSRPLFDFLEKAAEKIFKKETASLERIVLESSRIKAQVVGSDEFETKGARMILNFGHTFGHALEQATHYRKLLHGEAVSIGMVCAARLAVFLKMFPREEEARLIRLLRILGLPLHIPSSVKRAAILKAMQRDKKKHAGRLWFVLPWRIGRVVVREDVSLNLVRKVLEEL